MPRDGKERSIPPPCALSRLYLGVVPQHSKGQQRRQRDVDEFYHDTTGPCVKTRTFSCQRIWGGGLNSHEETKDFTARKSPMILLKAQARYRVSNLTLKIEPYYKVKVPIPIRLAAFSFLRMQERRGRRPDERTPSRTATKQQSLFMPHLIPKQTGRIPDEKLVREFSVSFPRVFVGNSSSLHRNYFRAPSEINIRLWLDLVIICHIFPKMSSS